ncbi:MAG: hypothetical protein U9Q68_05140 [Euryarchaeota archaeon]|nr:hypothetical protein [Euryarchaeota archaeon]
MGKIFAIACMMVLLMSTGLVSGERIAIEAQKHRSCYACSCGDRF